MTLVVVDASALVGGMLRDEDGEYADALLETIQYGAAYVPALFWFEIRNVLVISERRNRLTREDAAKFLSHLAVLPLEIDRDPVEATVMAFARQHNLTVYDASYLELAHRKGLPLATNGRALQAAAPLEGVRMFLQP